MGYTLKQTERKREGVARALGLALAGLKARTQLVLSLLYVKHNSYDKSGNIMRGEITSAENLRAVLVVLGIQNTSMANG